MKAQCLLMIICLVLSSLLLGVAAFGQDSWNVTRVGFLASDSVFAVAISGNYAYVGKGEYGSGLLVIDISNPSNPFPRGFCDLPGFTWGVALSASGNYAYMADGYYSGLRVVDISDPDNPVAKGYYDTNGIARGVAVFGNYAYVADGEEGLLVVDVSDPDNPDPKANYTPSGSNAQGVAISADGNFAYLADGPNGLRVINISDPLNPVPEGTNDTPDGWAFAVAVAGSHVYVADNELGLRVVDVSDPFNPFNVGTYNTPGYARGVAVSGGHAYVADMVAGLRVIDLSHPATQTYDEVGFYNTLGETWGVALDGSYAYVAEEDFGIYDCSDAVPVEPEMPAEIPASFTLCPPHPNPFNASTVISFELPVANLVQLEVFDVNGRDVGAHGCAPFGGGSHLRVLADTPALQWFPAGTHQITFDGAHLPSGIYLARLTAGEFSAVQKMVLLK